MKMKIRQVGAVDFAHVFFDLMMMKISDPEIVSQCMKMTRELSKNRNASKLLIPRMLLEGLSVDASGWLTLHESYRDLR